MIDGTGMHWATGLVIFTQLIFIIHQVFECLKHADNKQERRYLFLLIVLLIHNILAEIFPDQKLNIPIIIQNIVRYSGVLLVLIYCTFYFYRSFELTALKFHTRWGVWLLLISAYFFGIIGFYFLTNNISLSSTYAMIIPGIYSLFLICAIGRAIYKKHKDERLGNLEELTLLFLALSPYGLISFLSILGISQLQELILTNVAFSFFIVAHTREEFRNVRNQDTEVQRLKGMISQLNDQIAHLHNTTKIAKKVEEGDILADVIPKKVPEVTPENPIYDTLFEENCKKHLTKVQIEVIKMINEEADLNYEQIAKKRNKKLVTIKKHMNNIGNKLEVKGKEAILLKLKS